MSKPEILGSLMPPPGGGGVEAIEWEEIFQSWGTRFPSDYMRFMDIYGPGTIENFLSIFKPEPWCDNAAISGMSDETATALLTWNAESRRTFFPVRPDIKLIAWGVDAGADILCWDASSESPDDWPVIVWNRGDAAWRKYECNMTEFLYRVFKGEFDHNPLNGIWLWNIHEARFVGMAEEERLYSEGIDPWD